MTVITMLGVVAGAALVTALVVLSLRRRSRIEVQSRTLPSMGEVTNEGFAPRLAEPESPSEVVEDSLPTVATLPIPAVADVPKADVLSVTGKDAIESGSDIVPAGSREKAVGGDEVGRDSSPSNEGFAPRLAEPESPSEMVEDSLPTVATLPIPAIADVPKADVVGVTGKDAIQGGSDVVPTGAMEEAADGDDVPLDSSPTVNGGFHENQNEVRLETLEEKESAPVPETFADTAAGDDEVLEPDTSIPGSVVLSVQTDGPDGECTVHHERPSEGSASSTEEAGPQAIFTSSPLGEAEPTLSVVDCRASGTLTTALHGDVPRDVMSADTATESRVGENEFTGVSNTSDHGDGPAITGEPSQSEAEPSVIVVSAEPRPRRRRRQPSVYRDRRGGRRPRTSGERATDASPGVALPADALLRLAIRPIQRTVTLSLVLARSEGFPREVTLAGSGATVSAYDEGRYDDTDIPVGSSLIGGELRFDSLEGFQWLRTSRRIQIFSTSPSEPDLVSVSAARAGAEHAVLCSAPDVAEVRRIAALAGSPALTSHDGWPGVPAGCAVLSQYRPVRRVRDVDPSLRTLDPGESVEIELVGGLAIRPKAFAQGHPPSIVIDDLPEATGVSIGGERAQQSEGGSWVAPGWDSPGRHTIDVVPGPSVTYEVVVDPAYAAGWTSWNAHADRFGVSATLSWQSAQICGARLTAQDGGRIVAAQAGESSVALGLRSNAGILRRRDDVGVSVGAIVGDVAFLVSTSGGRRHQGRVTWLGYPMDGLGADSQYPGRLWIEVVRSASSRRLALVGADDFGAKAWRAAVARARAYVRERK
jgi:hypothetical protein